MILITISIRKIKRKIMKTNLDMKILYELFCDLLLFKPKIEVINNELTATHFSFQKYNLDPIYTIESICIEAIEFFKKESLFLELDSNDQYLTSTIEKTYVIGDIHGQYYDLIRIIHSQKISLNTRFIFLGDIVDRGPNSIECLLLILLMKILFPNNCFLIRGNHECIETNRYYGFDQECKKVFPDNNHTNFIWSTFNVVFWYLPLCISLHEKIFCVHGGISPQITDLNKLRDMKHEKIIPSEGLITDLLWSDPSESITEKFLPNDRGCSYIFSKESAKEFCEKFNFSFICRAHQCVQNGYEFFSDHHLITIFSASNYCNESSNFGAILRVEYQDSDELPCDIILFEPLDSTNIKQNNSFLTSNITDFFDEKTQYSPKVDIQEFVKENINTVSKNYDKKRSKSPIPFRLKKK